MLDGECVDHVRHYEEVLRELVSRVSAGTIALTHFVGVEGTPRAITIAFDGGEPHTFEAAAGTDWLDSPAVVAATNRLLADRGEARRLVEFHGSDLGQASGWVLLTPGELEALVEHGLGEDHTVSLCFADGKTLAPVSEDHGGDGPDPWENALLELYAARL
jgi:hypothetical protein